MTRAEYGSFCEANRATIEGLRAAGEGPSIDRIDSKGHYEVGNLRVVDARANARRASG